MEEFKSKKRLCTILFTNLITLKYRQNCSEIFLKLSGFSETTGFRSKLCRG